MRFEELVPHLNKIATLYLRNNKRKVGWLFVDSSDSVSAEPLRDVYFVCVQKGRKLTEALENHDVEALSQSQNHEKIPLEEIIRVRSTK
ncbi:MAG: hypothetical protein NT126_00940 [Bacteroidetes bacterium]|nr:hypothetical protein [Bacteroidota bacterium]